jgi:hypothetical protein
MSILPIETKFFGIQRNTESKVSRIVVLARNAVTNLCNTNGMLSSGSIINRIMIGTGTGGIGTPNIPPLINNNRYRVVAVSDNDRVVNSYIIYESLCNDPAVGPTQGGEWLHRALPENVFLNFIRLPQVPGAPVNVPFNTPFRAIIDYQAEEQPSLN